MYSQLEQLEQLEKEYQDYCKKFSKAYLSGSPWYVGPSIKHHIENKKMDLSALSFMFLLSHKLTKSN